MKIYILTDLEGVGCVVREQQTTVEGGREYDEARLLLTREVNVAVGGALEAGAEEVIVNDGHGARHGFNLVLEELHEGARYLIGGPRTRVLAGLDESFNAVFLVGYHAMAGAQGAIMDHTMESQVIVNAYINDRKVGEIGIEAAIAGYFKVPIALVTGCRQAVEEAKALLGDVEVVAVKEGVGRHSAICLPPAKVRGLIREAAKRALNRVKDFKPFIITPPIEIKVEFSHPHFADARAKMPGIERMDSRTIRCCGDNLLDLMRRVGWY